MLNFIYSLDLFSIRRSIIHLDIQLLYIDNDLAVCSKPAGVLSESPGMPDLLIQQLRRPVYPVHRLDQTTGGAMVFAFSPETCNALQKLFQQDLVVKDYLAVISGRPETDVGVFHDLLFHDRKNNKTFVVSSRRKGVREASCEWHVLSTLPHGSDTISLVSVRLHSGRTHQIRIQFASRGFPLVGDKKYGSRISAHLPSLWASRITFKHPCAHGKTVDVVSSPPDLSPWNLFDRYI